MDLRFTRNITGPQLDVSPFYQRIINDWNSLPNDVVTSPNVLTFKSKLDNFMYNQRFSFI